MKTNLVILASGNSQRFGSNKLLYELHGKAIIEHVFATCKQCNFEQVYVVTKYEAIYELAKTYGYIPLLNTDAYKGMSESIKKAVHACYECDQIMFLTADQPYIKANTLNTICTYGDGKHIISACVQDTIKNPMLFPSIYFNELLTLRKEEGGKKVAMKYKEQVLVVPVDEVELHDIDTMEDIL